MPTVDPFGGAPKPEPLAPPTWHEERATQQAAQLLEHFTAAKMAPDGFVPHDGMPGGTHIPKPHGLYTNKLIGPGVWPTESENAVKQASDDYKAFQQHHQDAADTVLNLRDEVFSTSWTSGDAADAADAADEHYGSPAAPPITGGGAGTPASAGFLPVRDQGAPQQVPRDVSMTDLQLARAAVADLAAASAVVYPGLEWAVVVSRGSSGVPEIWVTSNEGAGYIPAGVHLRRSMPLAARFDEDFDARWFGWFNPAETALRAVRARGDVVSAIATTWAQQSELVNDATPDVAIAVAPSSAPGDAEAFQLLNSRSHRLETVAPGIYQSVDRAEQHIAEAYARQLTQQAAFSGPELSSVAQSVARGLMSSRWPSTEEWTTLRSEYETSRLMAGSQRPGLHGYEQPEQLVG